MAAGNRSADFVVQVPGRATERRQNGNSIELTNNQGKVDYLSYEYREISYREGDEWRVNFAGLHRMILAKLQEELIDMVGKIRENDLEITRDTLVKIEPVLAKYTIAVRDWEYMVEHGSKAGDDISKDLFVASSAKPLTRKLMIDKQVIEVNPAQTPAQIYGPKQQTYLPGGQRRHVNAEKNEELRMKSWRARLERFWISVLGGVALIAPMLVMALHNDRTTALAITSGSVFLFAIIFAIIIPAPPEVALTAVSAYAAVLIVFVGSTLPTSTQ